MSIQRFLDISEAPDLDSFRGRVLDAAGWLDFGLVNACLVIEEPGQEARFIEVCGNTPADYLPVSTDLEASKRDPVLQRLKRSSVPVFYDQDVYVRAGEGESWEHQAAFGYRTGISVALHLPDRKHFLLGVDRDTGIAGDHLARMMADLQLLAVHVNAGAQRLLVPDPDMTEPPRLTPREIEILRWTIEGKSNATIALLLGVSEDTVKFHVKNLLRKLGAASKVQAAVRALHLGIVT